jgi:hypothetical protein
MSRRTELEARRRVLLARCDVQRAVLTREIAELRSAGVFGLPSLGGTHGRAGSDAAHHPLAWVLAIGGILLFGRTREALKIFVWARAALAVASRVAQVVRLVQHIRAPSARGGEPKPDRAPARTPREPAARARSVSG